MEFEAESNAGGITTMNIHHGDTETQRKQRIDFSVTPCLRGKDVFVRERRTTDHARRDTYNRTAKIYEVSL